MTGLDVIALVIATLTIGAPLIAFVIRCAVTGRRYARARWLFVAAYYAVLVSFTIAVGLGAPQAIGWAGCFLYIGGTILGAFLLSWPDPSITAERAGPRGFKVVPRLSSSKPDSRGKQPEDS